jgi:ribosomal protein L35
VRTPTFRPDIEHHLAELRDAKEYRRLVDKMIVEAAILARSKGATWLEIGTALGVTHQAARKRFKDHPYLLNGSKALVGGDQD